MRLYNQLAALLLAIFYIHATPSAAMQVHKRVLPNGLTVLVYPSTRIPKVSIQLWYNSGSKDEGPGQYGIAHWIEHMAFKGTNNLSETDISATTQKLSGYCNAYTSYDYVAFVAEFPTCNWKQWLPILADCMCNARFDQQMMNSELKAVIAELKMNRDHHVRQLIQELICAIFAHHPYSHPVIGYKQDLWTVHRDTLLAFYHQHYIPNNATLVIVGDVQPEQVFELAQQQFGHIKANPAYKRTSLPFSPDLVAKNIVMRCNVAHPAYIAAFVVPGLKNSDCQQALWVLEKILGGTKGSRLYQKLVEQAHLVTDVSSFILPFFESSLFCIYFEPQTSHDCPAIVQIIQQELHSIGQQGITDTELDKAVAATKMELYTLLETNYELAKFIGLNYLATGDENYLQKYLVWDRQAIKKDIGDLISRYFRSSLMHSGLVLPFDQDDKKQWLEQQQSSDTQDVQLLQERQRDEQKFPIEPLKYTHTIESVPPSTLQFAKPTVHHCPNGVELFHCYDGNFDKINLVLKLKANTDYEPNDQAGIYDFLSAMLIEGTAQLGPQEFSDFLETRGISLSISQGTIRMSMPAEQLESALQILKQIVTQAQFEPAAIQKVRTQLLKDVDRFWGEPQQFYQLLVDQELYKGHPWSTSGYGTKESFAGITRDQLIAFYKKVASPQGAAMAIVGKVDQGVAVSLVEKYLADWTGPAIDDIIYPPLVPVEPKERLYPFDTDQVLLVFAGPSVKFGDPDYEKLLLFETILSGGLNSRLFRLREQFGIFYTIQCSLLCNVGKQPGKMVIKTLVSPDQVGLAEKLIRTELANSIETITQQELIEAKNAIMHSFDRHYASGAATAYTFLFLHAFGLPFDYFDTKPDSLAQITLDQVKEAAKKHLQVDKLLTWKIGRV